MTWVPLTLDDARGILTQLDIAYEPVRAKDCSTFYPDDSEVLYRTEYLFEQSSAIIDGLRPENEYCVSIKVSTIGGESGFSDSILIPCTFYTVCVENLSLMIYVTVSVSDSVPFQIRFKLGNGVECSDLTVSNGNNY